MTAGTAGRQMLRESRGARGRLAFFVACLGVGVAAVVAVAGLSASLDQGIRSEARQLLAADLAVESIRPLPPAVARAASELPGAQTTRVRELVSVVAAPPRTIAGQAAPGPSQLVEIKAVDGHYPFYGTLEVEPRRPLAALLAPDTAVAAPELLAKLGVPVGGTIRIGGRDFRVAGTVRSEPDRLSISPSLGPRVFLSGAGLARTGLMGRGSRVEHRLLVKLPDGEAPGRVAMAAALLRRAAGAANVRVETYKEAQPNLREALGDIERFLGLVALLSLFIGGIGVAQSVRAWLAGRLDAIAVLKCLGMRPREVLGLYLGQTVLLGLAGSLAGIVAGAAVQWALPPLFPDLIPAELIRPWQPLALLRGLGLGVGVAVLFSLLPLADVLRVPPARVLRRDAEPLPRTRWLAAATLAALVAGVLAMAAAQSGSWELGARFTGGLAVAAGLLWLGAFAVTRGVARLPRERGGLAVRHGLAALGRPGAATVGAIVALGVGVLVVLGMWLVERRLGEELAADLPAGAPSAFLIDVQPDQWQGVRAILQREGARHIDSVPVVTARLLAVNGRSVEQIVRGDRERRWALTREQRLTYLRELPDDNKVVAGALWRDPRRAEVSVEEDFARDLGVGLGGTLGFDVQGVPLELVVTSLRTVDWRNFRINFFLVAEPGVLEAAPQMRLAAAELPRGREQRVQDLLAARYPNVTLIRVREVLEKVMAVLERIGLGIRFLGGFTVLAGIAILAGAVAAGAARRGREVALLKTLGMTRRGVAAAYAVEYALIGLVAGVIGAGGGALLAWRVLTEGFEMSWRFQPGAVVAAVAWTAVLTVLAGLGASWRALERRPIEVLRTDN
ncbi:MAG TPA: FtsX-like permease family protein [Thermoanaerobaculia bacterium]